MSMNHCARVRLAPAHYFFSLLLFNVSASAADTDRRQVLKDSAVLDPAALCDIIISKPRPLPALHVLAGDSNPL